MRIKVTEKEAMKLYSWRTRRRIKKHRKKMDKIPGYNEFIAKCVEEVDKTLAYGVDEKNGKS